MEWISVKDALPQVPEGKFAVHVLIVTYDAMYAEYCKDFQKGYDVNTAMFHPERGFEQLVCGPDGAEWSSDYMDEVTHWQYMPELLLKGF